MDQMITAVEPFMAQIQYPKNIALNKCVSSFAPKDIYF